MHSHQFCFPKETSIIAKQNKQAITVSAFFSVKYFLSAGEAEASNFFMVSKYKKQGKNFPLQIAD
jgi:hypothetical protein